MDPQFEGLNEQELRKLLDKADDYEERSKIRAAIRALKKSAGQDRRTTGTSVYRRPGFQTPRTVQIPNSVTGNVLPSSVKDGEPVKLPDKNTPTIGYLNATTVVKPSKRTGKKTGSSSSQPGQYDGTKENETWWNKSQSSSRSQTPSDTSEQRGYPSTTEGEMTEVFSEPPKEPTPEPPKEPTPEPPKEPTPEPLKEPTPSPEEPFRAPTPSPEPIEENLSSPEPEALVESGIQSEEPQEEEEEEEEQFSDEEDEELQALEVDEDRKRPSSHQKPSAGPGGAAVPPVNKSIPIDILQEVEPGLDEDKNFLTKLRKAEDTKIDTKAAFPSQKKQAEQIDFRNVLRKTAGPEKKSFKVEQVDFRENLKPKDETGSTHDNDEKQTKCNRDEQQHEEDQCTPLTTGSNEQSNTYKEEKSIEVTVEEDSYEARREARRREKEERERQRQTVEKSVTDTVENGIFDEDSYEARREARRKAREAKRLQEQQESTKDKPLTYKEKQQLEQAKRAEEKKKQGGTKDEESTEKPAVSRQKSSTGAQRGAQQLLAWCQHKTRYYENVDVKDFSASFANGLALCAILHSFVPDDIPYDDLSPDNPAENFGVALQVSEDLGIGSFFDVEDLVSVKAPDPKSMMTYLATIYQHFK